MTLKITKLSVDDGDTYVMVEMAIIVVATVDDDNSNDNGQWQGKINCDASSQAKFIQNYFLRKRMFRKQNFRNQKGILEQKYYSSPFLVHIRPYLVPF